MQEIFCQGKPLINIEIILALFVSRGLMLNNQPLSGKTVMLRLQHQ